MQKVAFYLKWLDGSNGLVKDCPKNEMEQNETGTQNPAKPSRLTAGLLGRMAKGVVSFLQNLLFPQTQKEVVRCGQVSAFFQPAAAVVVGVGLLVGSAAEAQLPTFEIYGVDTTYVHRYVGGQWHETETAVNNVYKPGGSIKGVASYRLAAPYQDCVPDWNSGHAFFMAIEKLVVASTVWYSDGTHLTKEDYDEYCAEGQRHRNDYLEGVTDPPPSRYLSNKAMVVGTIETRVSSRLKRVKRHWTPLRIEATHTSGVKNFTFTIKYRVEGSTEVTTVQRSVVLGPGHKRSIRLFVPAGGSWATIDSITVHEKRRPDPKPVIVPVPVPVPVPAPPSNPNPNPRRPR